MKTKLTLITLFASITMAQGNIIPIGEVTFTGDFTLNHLYSFNDPAAQPFGWFHDQTVANANGIFEGLSGVLAGQPLWSVNNLPLFSLQEFNFTTLSVGIGGSDSGRYVIGQGIFEGNVNPDLSVFWNFTAPPYDISNFHEDITGPITFGFFAFLDNHHVPDTGTTLVLALFAYILLLVGLHIRSHS